MYMYVCECVCLYACVCGAICVDVCVCMRVCVDVWVCVCISEYAFHPQYGGRPGATKVMVVVSDGESNDKAIRDQVIAECEQEGIIRFSIAVSLLHSL